MSRDVDNIDGQDAGDGGKTWTREEVVRKVKELARRKDISLYQEPEVVDVLLDLDLEDDLPPSLLAVVSELVNFLSDNEI